MRALEALFLTWGALAVVGLSLLFVLKLDGWVQAVRKVGPDRYGGRPDGPVAKVGLVIIGAVVLTLLITHGGGGSGQVVDGCYGSMRC
jgi:hypothetical protein